MLLLLMTKFGATAQNDLMLMWVLLLLLLL